MRPLTKQRAHSLRISPARPALIAAS